MAARSLPASRDNDEQRLAAFGRVVLDRIQTVPLSSLRGRTAGALLVELLRDARRCDLLDDNFGGNVR